MNDLASLSQIIRERGWDIYRIARVSEDGAVEEVTLRKGNRCTNVYSIAKAFCVAAAGVLYDEGNWSPDEKILSVLELELMGKSWPDLVHKRGLKKIFKQISTKSYNLLY